MAVMRIHKTKDYTVMSNTHFREKELSLKAKGLLSLMLSLPDDWDYSIAGLVTLSKDGKDSVMSGLDELEENCYLIRTMLKDESGKFAGYDYDIFETPYGEKPYAENPNTGKPNTEIPPQYNTKQSSTNILNTKKIYIDEFEILWKMYPRKQGKPKALNAYIKARKNGTTFEEVKQGIENYCKHIKAKQTETEYIKHGSTWFNNRCWTDEYDYTPRSGKPATKQKRSDGSEYADLV